MVKICSKKNCGKPVKAKGLCRKHYDQDYYDLSKGNGHSSGPIALAADGGHRCAGCDKPLRYRAGDATLCGACIKQAFLRA